MKLLTKEILKKLPKLGATDGNPNAKAQVKFFGGGSYSFYVFEYDGEDQMFGYVVGLGHNELGYASFKEIQAVKFPPLGLGVERDMWYTPETLDQIKARAGER